jgi:hypothetical protein
MRLPETPNRRTHPRVEHEQTIGRAAVELIDKSAQPGEFMR